MVELHRMVAAQPPEELAGVRALLAVPPISGTTSFEDQLTTVLVGHRGTATRGLAADRGPGRFRCAATGARRVHFEGGGNSHRLNQTLESAAPSGVGSQRVACTEIGSWL